MDKKLLNNNDYCRAAKKIKCNVAAIKAVDDTESRGKGFYADGFPVILFERHIFKKYTKGRYNTSHPHLSGAPGNYGPAGQNQRNKFNEAFELDADAAMMSCSWGRYQIMGFNYAICGYKSVGDFVDAMKESEGKQLDAFVNFVIHNGLDKHLRTLNWAGFAKGYNGTGYKKNKYDTKLASAYSKFLKQNIDCDSLPVEDSSVENIIDPKPTAKDKTETTGQEVIDDYPLEPKPGEATPDSPAEEGQPVVGGRPGDPPKEIDAITPTFTSGLGAWVANIRAQWAAAGIGFPALGSLAFLNDPVLRNIALGLVAAAIVSSLIIYITSMIIKAKEKRAREKEAHEITLEQMRLAADPTKYNVVVKQ